MWRTLTFNLVVSIVAVFTSTTVMATNGMNMIGANTRSTGVGGADVALSGDCPGCNPATLGGGGDSLNYLSVGMAVLHAPVGFKNQAFGPNDVEADDDIYYAPYLEYARHFGQDSPWTIGVTLRAQGGMGVDFNNVRTIAGNNDDLYTDIQVARIMPTLSYRINSNLSIGTSLIVGRAQMNSKLFPDTYSPGMDGMPNTQDDFVGMEIDDVNDMAYSGRIGLHYQVHDRLNLGLSYTSESKFDLDDGQLILNLGTAKVAYDSYVDGFTWPQETEAGVTFLAMPKLLFTTDVHGLTGQQPLMNLLSMDQIPIFRFQCKTQNFDSK
ncbi:MAG: hypothetical protein GY801_00820 [bacterium]|nr:hypothetical protein [bacterium]